MEVARYWGKMDRDRNISITYLSKVGENQEREGGKNEKSNAPFNYEADYE